MLDQTKPDHIPPLQKFWLNIYSGVPLWVSGLHPDRESADRAAEQTYIPRFACIEVEFQEGEGL